MMNEVECSVEQAVEQLRRALEPLSNLAEILGRSVVPSVRIDPPIPAIEGLRELQDRLATMFSGIPEQLRFISPALQRFTEHEARCARLEKAGWLPHPASPWHLLDDESLSDESLNEAVEAYYLENWFEVRASIESAIIGFAIDDEAKSTFREALCAHEAGLYRCVARTLFPEIERVSRDKIHDGAMDRIASQTKLQEAIGSLSPADLARDGISGVRLYNKLIDHMYVSMPTSERVSSIAADPVPNRHAALHGYVAYNTQRHSVNALIIAEYLFQAITVIMQIDQLDEAIETQSA